MALLRRPLSPSRRALSRCHPPTAPPGLWWPSTTTTRSPTLGCCCRHPHRPPRHRGGGGCAGRPWRPPQSTSARPQGTDPGARAGGGGDCIDDADLLRSGSTAAVLGHKVMAPSTLGRFLRSFTFGHLRQLDRVAETIMVGRGRRVLTRRCAGDDRPGLHHLRGPRPPPTRRCLRLHPPARRSPAAGHPGRHRRGAARPPAHRAGRLRPRRRAVGHRTRRPHPPRRRQRAAHPPG